MIFTLIVQSNSLTTTKTDNSVWAEGINCHTNKGGQFVNKHKIYWSLLMVLKRPNLVVTHFYTDKKP